MAEERQIAYCPHCAHRSPQRVVFTQEYEDSAHVLSGVGRSGGPSTYHVVLCDVCNRVLLYEHWGTCSSVVCVEGVIVWPSIVGDLHHAVPERVREIYQEAHSIRRVAPNAFAVQIRRALEALCQNRGVQTGSLSSRLQGLVGKGELPAVLAEMTDVLRLLGNIGAHADKVNVNIAQVSAVDEFFRAIIEYV